MKPIIPILVTLHAITAVVVFAADTHIFTSEVHGFSMQYPASWNRAETTLPQTVIRVESPGGDDYNIVVTQDPSLRSITPQQFADGMLSNADMIVPNVLAKNYPDARLVKKGITQLSQQPAFFYIADFTLKAAGRELPMRSYVISTKSGDKHYILTFRTPQPVFEQFLPVIQQLAIGFQLKK